VKTSIPKSRSGFLLGLPMAGHAKDYSSIQSTAPSASLNEPRKSARSALQLKGMIFIPAYTRLVPGKNRTRRVYKNYSNSLIYKDILQTYPLYPP
jgi:hypothetical protein